MDTDFGTVTKFWIHNICQAPMMNVGCVDWDKILARTGERQERDPSRAMPDLVDIPDFGTAQGFHVRSAAKALDGDITWLLSEFG